MCVTVTRSGLAIAALCASHQMPAMVTYKAKGVVADTDPHFAGVFTNGAIERAIVAGADLLIGVGLDPVELLPRPWTFTPPIVKQRIVKAHLRRCGASTVVETGTFRGDMVDALAPIAARIVSIELDDQLYAAACRRFAAHPHVELLHGDSGTLLPGILSTLDRPALFWLDGHYTGVGSARTRRSK